MLSHLFRLAASFQRTHGYRPNLLYLNRGHYRALRENLAGMRTEEEVAQFLGMDVLITPEIEHPDVAWVTRQRRAAANR